LGSFKIVGKVSKNRPIEQGHILKSKTLNYYVLGLRFGSVTFQIIMFMNWKLGTTSESSFKGSQITSEMRML
jgi:hypothetical protein